MSAVMGYKMGSASAISVEIIVLIHGGGVGEGAAL